MPIRFQADNDLRRHLVWAVKRKEAAVDFQTAQTACLDGMNDLDVLRKAAAEGRILVSHDKRSMPHALATLMGEGVTCPGVFLVIPQNAEVQRVADCLILIWAASSPEEWKNRITKIPF